MSTAKSLYINIYTIFKADAPERYLHDLASNVRELPHGSIERIKETIEYLTIDFDSQINSVGEERRQISVEQKKGIKNIVRMDSTLTVKDDLVKEVLRFYSDLVEIDLRMRPQEEVFRVCDNVLGVNTDDIEQSIQLLLEACSLREKKKVPGTKTKTTPVREKTSNNNNISSIDENPVIEIHPITESKTPHPQPQKETKKETKKENNNNINNKDKQKNKNNNNNQQNNKKDNKNQKNKNKNNQNNNNNQQNKQKINNIKVNDNQPKKKENNNDNIQSNEKINDNNHQNKEKINTQNNEKPNVQSEQKTEENKTNKDNKPTPSPINFKIMTKNEINKFKSEQDIKFESLVKKRKELALEMQKVEEEISNMINQRNDMLGVLLNSK